ncbi:Hypothetical predicted protein, partial [Mytilus galloprovincialis]
MAHLLEEKENYVRLALLLEEVSPRAVRTYFDREFPPTHLPSTLNTNYNTLLNLKSKRVLNQAQWNLLFPSNGVPDSISSDVTGELNSNIFDVIDVPEFITFDVID